MPFEHSWLVEDRVLFVRMWGDLTLDELQDSATQSLARLESLDHPIHELFDQTEVDSMATHVTEIRRFVTPVTSHKNLGWVILYGMQNKLLKFIISMIGQLSYARIHIVDTRADAFKILMKIDPSLKEELEKLSK